MRVIKFIREPHVWKPAAFGALIALFVFAGVSSTQVGAQQIMRIYGTVSGAPIALLANSSGVLRVALDSGTVTSLTFAASTCAAPAINETGALTTGIAFTAVPAVSIAVAGNCILTATANGVGIGVSPVAADGLSKTLQTGNTAIIQNVVGTQALFGNNAYYDGGWKYATAATAQAVRMDGTSIMFPLAASGSAGGAITNWDGSDVRMGITTTTVQLASPMALEWSSGNFGSASDVSVGRLAADIFAVAAGDAYGLASKAWIRTAPSAPTACTDAAVTWSNGNASWQIDVGTSCTGISTLVVTLPAGTNAHACKADNRSNAATMQPAATGWGASTITFTNFSRTLGTAADWADGADVIVSCTAG